MRGKQAEQSFRLLHDSNGFAHYNTPDTIVIASTGGF